MENMEGSDPGLAVGENVRLASPGKKEGSGVAAEENLQITSPEKKEGVASGKKLQSKSPEKREGDHPGVFAGGNIQLASPAKREGSDPRVTAGESPTPGIHTLNWRVPAIRIYEESLMTTFALPIAKYFEERHAYFIADTHKNGHPDPQQIASFITDLQNGFQQQHQLGWLVNVG